MCGGGVVTSSAAWQPNSDLGGDELADTNQAALSISGRSGASRCARVRKPRSKRVRPVRVPIDWATVFFHWASKCWRTSLGFAWVLNTAKTCDFPRGLTLGGALNLQEKLHIL